MKRITAQQMANDPRYADMHTLLIKDAMLMQPSALKHHMVFQIMNVVNHPVDPVLHDKDKNLHYVGWSEFERQRPIEVIQTPDQGEGSIFHAFAPHPQDTIGRALIGALITDEHTWAPIHGLKPRDLLKTFTRNQNMREHITIHGMGPWVNTAGELVEPWELTWSEAEIDQRRDWYDISTVIGIEHDNTAPLDVIDPHLAEQVRQRLVDSARAVLNKTEQPMDAQYRRGRRGSIRVQSIDIEPRGPGVHRPLHSTGGSPWQRIHGAPPPRTDLEPEGP